MTNTGFSFDSTLFPALGTAEPFWKFTARLQIETIALMSRRAQACMELPSTLARCASPQDILTEQVRYWQLAQRHYMQSLGTVAGSVPAADEPEAAQALARPRDYLVVAEPAATEPAPVSTREQTRETRKPQPLAAPRLPEPRLPEPRLPEPRLRRSA